MKTREKNVWKDPDCYLSGESAVVVIVFIAVFVTSMGGSCTEYQARLRPGATGRTRPGAGSGLWNRWPGEKIPVLQPLPDSTPLTTRESGDILFMREEEQLAHDLYMRWYGMYSIPVFSNIAASETMHVNEVQLLIDRYGLQGNRIGNASTGYHNATIQSLYDSLAVQGDANPTGALEASLAVEERDIADLDHALAGTTRADIIQVYSNLRRGSDKKCLPPPVSEYRFFYVRISLPQRTY